MEQPPGFEMEDGKVCLLLKSLYGLKQAPRSWYARLNSFLISLGFTLSEYDPSLYIKFVNSHIVMLLIYVDDIILSGSLMDLIIETKSALNREFKMQDLGELHYILGLEIVFNEDHVFISQSRYALSMLKKLHMENCKSVDTPMEQLVKDPIKGDERSF